MTFLSVVTARLVTTKLEAKRGVHKMNATTINVILILALGVIASASIGYYNHARQSYDPCAGSGLVGTMQTPKPCY